MSRRDAKVSIGRKSITRDESFQRDLDINSLEGVNDHSPFHKNHNIASGRHQQNDPLKTLSEQLEEVRADGSIAAASNIQLHGNHFQKEQINEEMRAVSERRTRFKRVKRRKFRGKRKSRTELEPVQDAGDENWEGKKFHEQKVTTNPKGGCGVPWNWSSIHLRGKSFFDIAGRSLSCGMSESKLKRMDLSPRGQGISDMPVMPNYSSSSASSTQAPPLRVEASESQESTDYATWFHQSSGELGIYPDNLLIHGIGSELALEPTSDDHHKFRRYRGSRHQNLTQKYIPSSFRDLVGQNLVTQALSNAVAQRKVGLMYVFYGPHGTGKTTCARIFAQALNCQSLELTKPCGFCNSCIAFTTGKSLNIREMDPIANLDFESIMDILDDMVSSNQQSQYRVIIVDGCDTLTPECWSAISKVVDRTPRHVVFVLVNSSLDVFPHTILFRCQKFFFPKLKEAEMIWRLQNIAINEDLEIDDDALKLIASRSDGSMRDAEMTLEQLSLLGQRISVSLVQELVGLVSDEKLIDLLDLALSADTVNTVKNLREIMEAGVEPLALMSQLATVITDILAGSYDFEKEGPRRKFFCRQTLLNEDMEKLRQALKILSDSEKQLRNSNDKLTWLTVAMLQLAPDINFTLPSSLADMSLNHRRSNVEMADFERLRLTHFRRTENLEAENSGDLNRHINIEAKCRNRRRHDMSAMTSQEPDMRGMSEGLLPGSDCNGIEEIWFQVLEKIHIRGIKEFMYEEGKLVAVTFGAAATVELMFSSQLNKSKAEKYRDYISQLFESVLGSPVTIKITCETKNGNTVNMEGDRDRSSHVCRNTGKMNSDGTSLVKESGGLPEAEQFQSEPFGVRKSEITEIGPHRFPNDRRFSGQIHRKSIGRSDKLEHENLKLEPSSRRLGWRKSSRVSQPKVLRLKVRTKKPKCSLRYVCCGRCSSASTPR